MASSKEGETDMVALGCEADAAAVECALKVEPQWCGMARVTDILPTRDPVLLHAGPPIEGEPCAPIVNSACLAALLEGWAESIDEAESLLRSGAVRLAPAQDHGVVVPLAAVASPSTRLLAVEDRNSPGRPLYSPINEGPTDALRLGRRDTAILDHLRWLNGDCAETLAGALAEPVTLLPVADMALQNGDDCHGRTNAASACIAEMLALRLKTSPDAERALGFVRGAAGFFLNLWMAASALMMRAADGRPGTSLVRAAAGNGVQFGLQISGLPGRWFTAPAAPPRGPIDDPQLRAMALGAIGDSAVVDSFGLGGMALSFADDVLARLKSYVPADAIERPRLLLAGSHPRLARSGARVALTARRVAAVGRTPLVTLGILDRSGIHGRIGGGVFEPPVEPFIAAVEALGADRRTRAPDKQ